MPIVQCVYYKPCGRQCMPPLHSTVYAWSQTDLKIRRSLWEWCCWSCRLRLSDSFAALLYGQAAAVLCQRQFSLPFLLCATVLTNPPHDNVFHIHYHYQLLLVSIRLNLHVWLGFEAFDELAHNIILCKWRLSITISYRLIMFPWLWFLIWMPPMTGDNWVMF